MPVRRGHVAPPNIFIDTIIRKFDGQRSTLMGVYANKEISYNILNGYQSEPSLTSEISLIMMISYVYNYAKFIYIHGILFFEPAHDKRSMFLYLLLPGDLAAEDENLVSLNKQLIRIRIEIGSWSFSINSQVGPERFANETLKVVTRMVLLFKKWGTDKVKETDKVWVSVLGMLETEKVLVFGIKKETDKVWVSVLGMLETDKVWVFGVKNIGKRLSMVLVLGMLETDKLWVFGIKKETDKVWFSVLETLEMDKVWVLLLGALEQDKDWVLVLRMLETNKQLDFAFN
ncbi:LOW QUALITY PROTEIN: hypothetical protein KUTeg_008507 [Tegillarca granosa]|uniref:Uncharacterized protein n=1 Tax=Tegillarca granosa TaxID=220873 RepID=A0ABQ9FCK3_TEGGR|nr:LOW QUALITY PROTEIN: hypothetical protein KUTeg_008507 [Tegillarca granosa]